MNIKFDIIAVGSLRNGACFDLVQEYTKRLKQSLNIIEIQSKSNRPHIRKQDEQKKIIEQIKPKSFVIALDERGKDFSSVEFAEKISNLADTGKNHIQFIIGGADGLSQDIRDKSQLILRFGKQTWPHMMVRAMLCEQIYRAEKIIQGHPYHRA